MVKLFSFTLLFALSGAHSFSSQRARRVRLVVNNTPRKSATVLSSSLSDPIDPKGHNKRSELRKYLDGSSISRVRGGGMFSASEKGDTSSEPTTIDPEVTTTPSTIRGGPSSKLLHGQGYMFSGSLLPTIRQILAGGTESYARGWKAVKQFHHIGDVAVLATVALAPYYILQGFHYVFYKIATQMGKKEKSYEDSRLSSISRSICQMGQIAALVYAVEVVTTFLIGILSGSPKAAAPVGAMTKSISFLQKFPDLFANCAYGVWITRKVLRIKSRLLNKFIARLPDPETYDSFLNFSVSLVAAILVLDASSFDLGALVKSLVAVGGLSSIVVGLALKEPATQLISGVLLMAANKFRRNESIRLGDGTQGKVVEIGLLETTIVGGDDIWVKIPNSKLSGQKFSNISRMKQSQVKFQLRFNLHQMHRIEEICSSIKEEIAASCDKLITDGARPFRVIWTDIADDHIAVTVDTHFQIPPSTNAYWIAREQVLKAIARATKNSGTRFAMPVTVNAEYLHNEVPNPPPPPLPSSEQSGQK